MPSLMNKQEQQLPQFTNELDVTDTIEMLYIAEQKLVELKLACQHAPSPQEHSSKARVIGWVITVMNLAIQMIKEIE